MKISIENFKGIEKLDRFELNRLNILAGANSCGKSSIIHAFLLLKQSLEIRSIDAAPLRLNRPYVSLGSFNDVLRKAPTSKQFSITLHLEIEDIPSRLIEVLEGKRKAPGLEFDPITNLRSIDIGIKFIKTSKILVDEFSITINASVKSIISLKRTSNSRSYKISTNSKSVFFRTFRYFKQHIRTEQDEITAQVSFFSFFPYDLNFEKNGEEYSFSSILSQLRTATLNIFKKISYIGPLREEPKAFYYHDDDSIDAIGNKGENAAFVLTKHANDTGRYRRYKTMDDGQLKVRIVESTLIQEVNYWLCDVFKMASKVEVIKVAKRKDIYEIYLTNKNGDYIPITHVGFGISQILPILVEALRPTNEKRIIILEQPEIHLHPKVQSLLFDFLNLASRNISFLIETHSDHMITRLRRRVAEDKDNMIKELINLTFVASSDEGVDYKPLHLSDIGTFEYWPDGFFDDQENDLRALVKAQAMKQIAKKG